MAAPTQTTITRVTGTNTSGSTFNGATQDCRTDVAVRFFGSVTNGGTAPTIPVSVNLQVSTDNFASDVDTVETVTGSLTNSAVTTFNFWRLYPGSYTRIQITGNTAQSITYVIAGTRITGIV